MLKHTRRVTKAIITEENEYTGDNNINVEALARAITIETIENISDLF